jgi:predicted RNA-binding protein YlqC (UPF0109 family)
VTVEHDGGPEVVEEVGSAEEIGGADEVDGAGEIDDAEEIDGEVDDDAGNRIDGATARAVLDFLARSIVDDPDAVVIEVEEGRRALTLRLHVAQGDMGKVIGKRGRVAQAIRTVVRAAGARDEMAVDVDIVD